MGCANVLAHPILVSSNLDFITKLHFREMDAKGYGQGFHAHEMDAKGDGQVIHGHGNGRRG